MHKEIFDLCYYSKSGFIWSDVYSMPVHLRRFYIQQTVDAIEKENKQYDDNSTSSTTFHQPNVDNPHSLYSKK
jgi:hypothetical protein